MVGSIKEDNCTVKFIADTIAVFLDHRHDVPERYSQKEKYSVGCIFSCDHVEEKENGLVDILFANGDCIIAVPLSNLKVFSLVDQCPCGRLLHYSNPQNEYMIRQMVRELGPEIRVTLLDGSRSWMIPRHFLALHGLKGQELVEVTRKYGFKEVTNAAEA